MRGTRIIRRAPLLVLVLAGLMSAVVSGQEVEWVRQFGTDGIELCMVSAYGGDVYAYGQTNGVLGESNAGSHDAFVRKYDADGTEQWTRQFGTSTHDHTWGACFDSDGNIYMCGSTWGALPGQTNKGGQDAWVRKYDTDFNEQWTRQFGTTGQEYATQVVADGPIPTGIYVVGATQGVLEPGKTNAGETDAYIRKYDLDGGEQWTRQFGGSATDAINGACVDTDGNIYVCGYTAGDIVPGGYAGGSCDAFLAKYDADGTEQWIRQFGTTGWERNSGVCVGTDGYIYVYGSVQGSLPGQTSAGSFDAYIRKYDTNGNEVWTRQFGTTGWEDSGGIRGGPTGIYVVGAIWYAAFPGQTYAGEGDIFVRKYDFGGNELWTSQFGSSGDEYPDNWNNAISLTSTGLYVAGVTDGTFPGQTYAGGYWDVFIAKLTVTQDPVTLLGALVELVQSLNLQHGIENSLDKKLERAQNALQDLNENNDIAAVNALEAFINEVQAQSGNKISVADADALVAKAQVIIDMLDQGGGGGQAGATPSLLADDCVLLQNSPNPLRNETAIQFSLPDRRITTLTIYDVAGRPIETLVDDKLMPGVYTFSWQAEAPAGTYFYRLQTGDFTDMKKMVVVR